MIAHIYERLYIGDIDSLAAIGEGEWVVIRCCQNDYGYMPPSFVPLLSIPFTDEGEGLTEFKLEMALEFARRSLGKDKNLLVHCIAGSNRSVMVCACILEKWYDMIDEDAMALLKEKCPAYAPDDQLCARINELRWTDFKIL